MMIRKIYSLKENKLIDQKSIHNMNPKDYIILDNTMYKDSKGKFLYLSDIIMVETDNNDKNYYIIDYEHSNSRFTLQKVYVQKYSDKVSSKTDTIYLEDIKHETIYKIDNIFGV